MLPVIQVVVDGRVVSSIRQPMLVAGSVEAPLEDLRFIAQRVWYRADDRSITVQRADRQIVLFVGRVDAWINGRRGSVPIAPMRVGDTLYVPLAVCARALGGRVGYDARTRTVAVMLPAPAPVLWTPPPTPFFVPTPFPSPTSLTTPSAAPTASASAPSTPALPPQPRRTPLAARPSWP